MGPLCLNQFKTRSHFGSFTLTFGLSNESEQIPYVLKQGSPDMSCVAMTTCNRKDKNNCHSFTESCKYFYIWGTRFCPREAFTQAQTCSQSTVINIILYYITLAPTERNVCGWNQEVVTGVNSLQRHANSTKNTDIPQQCSRLLKCHTFRMELSCRVFLVLYPSRRHRRVVQPDPANSDRFKSAKPSCRRTQESLHHLVGI